ncbi:phosphotransferase [Shouchella sp. 1P09AA]|uniref:phosphotransferase n=1 Tax=unclassified Shouchella TaxID=2893065 RepID=UPI0039A2E02F
MKSFKLTISYREVFTIVTHHYPSARNLKEINMGELSMVYTFDTQEGPHVIHLRLDQEGLIRNKWISDHYASHLPIPRIVGPFEKQGVFYTFSERMRGKPVSSFTKNEQLIIARDLADCYSSMVNVKTGATFGLFGDQSVYQSWTDLLESFFTESTDGFYANWTTLFHHGILEEHVFQKGYEKMIERTHFAPEQPFLVHGDFHLGNMMATKNKVTGLLDWELAMRGDFMFDVAGLHFWSPDLQFPTMIQETWAAKGIAIPHFEERLNAGLLFKAVDGLRFYAKQEHQAAYHYMKQRMYELIDA